MTKLGKSLDVIALGLDLLLDHTLKHERYPVWPPDLYDAIAMVNNEDSDSCSDYNRRGIDLLGFEDWCYALLNRTGLHTVNDSDRVLAAAETLSHMYRNGVRLNYSKIKDSINVKEAITYLSGASPSDLDRTQFVFNLLGPLADSGLKITPDEFDIPMCQIIQGDNPANTYLLFKTNQYLTLRCDHWANEKRIKLSN
jgi:hypothetical protein